MEMGYVHMYTGDGKGKTTAAVGLTVRAAGCGKKVVFCQFLKDNQTGELSVLEKLPEVTLIKDHPLEGFLFSMTPDELALAREEQQKKWKLAVSIAEKIGADLLILDEIVSAVTCGLIPEEWVTEFLCSRPQTLEVVLTGRNPPESIMELCDYQSEIKALRHPYDRGIPARKGIEY